MGDEGVGAMDWVIDLGTGRTRDRAVLGGKGARLDELAGVAGVDVPPGFCVTTHAYRAAAGGTVPDAVAAAIGKALVRHGGDAAYAVRSSATAEDLPLASFAGQHDSYLNVAGRDAILEHVRRCWASLFTERAIAYRHRQGIDERTVSMAVVVQRMVDAGAAGVMFTADPVTSNRRTAVVEAARGLGDDLASGRTRGERCSVRDGRVVRDGAGAPVLTDDELLTLVELGRRIEAHFAHPQDIEWCLAGGRFHVVQSRPITTVFPVPPTDNGETHVYLSVGHQQMMTDAMRPLGLSFWQMTTPRPMQEAGSRLFVDVTAVLATPTSRAGLLETLGRNDPLIRDALQTLLDRGDVIATRPDDGSVFPHAASTSAPIEADASVVPALIAANEASVAALRATIRDLSGLELLDFVTTDLVELKRLLFDPHSHAVIMAGMEASWWLAEHLDEWLGERAAADVLAQSVEHNVTAEMGLALLDVADAVRPYPGVVASLRRVVDQRRTDDAFLDELADLDGGRQARAAIEGFLDRYGMRCAGEIDITRPRWREHPVAVLPAVLGHVAHAEPGAAARRFEQGRQAARRAELDILARLRDLPDGAAKADQAQQRIALVRTYAGYREYPKFGMISRYYLYRQALLGEAGRLVAAGVLHAPDDLFFLRWEELRDVVRDASVDHELIRRRREAFDRDRSLRAPRVLTSDGETLDGRYRRDDLPTGALPGLAVSAGVVVGRARVVLDMTGAVLEDGDILVTTYTDPSWTPLFVTAVGLVTEVGGLMTHGAVIAREYGLPAVINVDGATRRILDGQRIRVDGTAGYVEILDPA